MSNSLFEDATPDEVKNAKVRTGRRRMVFRWELKLTFLQGPSFDHPKHAKWTKAPDHAGRIARGLWNEVDDDFRVNPTLIFLPPARSLLNIPLSNISTNEQKKDWFLRLNPNGKKNLQYPEEPCTQSVP